VGGRTADELIANAQLAEAAGFDVLHVGDHVGDDWAPLTTLATMAAATERVRLCPLVLNNDFHHPVQLAREFASLDHLSSGRVELGIGAGHSFPEYEAIGLAFDPPAVRKVRMAEAVEILRGLLDGEEVTFAGTHYQLKGVRTRRSLQAHLPILVGVNGKAALAHAARHADTIGLMMLGRTRPDGQTHETRWEVDRLDATAASIRESASHREQGPELHALIQQVIVTDDRAAVAKGVVEGGWVPTIDDALATPFLAIGTQDEIADHLHACRERWGISYFTVRDVASFAPLITRCRA
jgi:probable F420-dependent oxidoreductase, MSMEG_2516 family